MKYAILIDINRCSLCYACQVACKDEFVGNAYPPYSLPQPDAEQEWIKVTEIEKGTYPYIKVYPIPVMCMHCEKAACIQACPVAGAIYKNANGAVIIAPDKCKPSKCKTKPCMADCPYRMIFFNQDSNICQKCTLCLHRLREGQQPACIDACPSDVFLFGEESAIAKEARKRGAKPLHPEYKTAPRIYYLGLPAISLAGHVIGKKSLMDVPDAKITITDLNTGAVVSVKSNIAGNFLAQNLKMGNSYAVQIVCDGYQTKDIDAVQIDNEYRHLGDIKITEA